MLQRSQQASGLWLIFFSPGWFLPLPGSGAFHTLSQPAEREDYFQLSSHSNKDVKSLLLPPAHPACPPRPRGDVRERQAACRLGVPEHPHPATAPLFCDPGETSFPVPPGTYPLILLFPSLQAPLELRWGSGWEIGVLLGSAPLEDARRAQEPRAKVSIEAEAKGVASPARSCQGAGCVAGW